MSGYTIEVDFLVSDLASACRGRLQNMAGDAVDGTASVSGVSIDSRSVSDGELFVPIVADRDGHDFIGSAVAAGASAYLTSKPADDGDPVDGAVAIEVDDTAAALTAIGHLARSRLPGPIIGITGSVGKTSVKDLTVAACRGGGRAWASVASFNNELGVPLTLANAADSPAVGIVEMGARGVGHIAELAAIARPTIGVVTAVALAHSELFGSLEGVAAAKGEMVEALGSDGVAVLNGDDPLVSAMATRTDAQVITYGHSPDADVRALDVKLDRLLRPTVVVEAPELLVGSERGPRVQRVVTLPVSGHHMAANALGAVAAALAAGVGFAPAVDGLATASLSRWRMEVVESPSGLLVINDAYNANPTSMRAALDALIALDVDKPVAVVGLMAELGPEGPSEHRAIAAEALSAGVRLIAVDAAEYGDTAEHVADRAAAADLLSGLGPGAAVLVKGSRVAGLEALASELVNAAGS